MFLEASLGLAFRRSAEVVRVPAPTLVGRALHLLTLGQTGEAWERETFDAAEMIRSLADALRDAGVTNLISAAVDDEIVHRDERREAGDLDPVLRAIARRCEEDEGPLRLELVAEHHDEVGTYLVLVSADRVHPVERLPLRIQVYALIRAFDVTTLTSEGYRGTPGRVGDRLEQKMLEMIGSPSGLTTVVGPLEARLVELCRRIEQGLRERLDTYPTEEVLLCCAIRPRAAIAWESTRERNENHPIAPLRPYPGMREATLYLFAWLGVLTRVGAKINRTLILDEAGRPVLHIGHEAADLARTQAFVPGQSIAQSPGALDVVCFAGHDYEQELREGGRMTPSEGEHGEAMWKLIRERELGVMPEVPHAQRLGPSANAGIFDRVLVVYD
jgi:hypothetical protein